MSEVTVITLLCIQLGNNLFNQLCDSITTFYFRCNIKITVRWR